MRLGPDQLPPDATEVAVAVRGMATAVAPASGLTPSQAALITAVVPAMTGFPADVAQPPITPAELALGLARRDQQFRTRIVQVMILCALVLDPLPEEVVEQVAAFARALDVDDGMLTVAVDMSHGAYELAAVDFERNGYVAEWTSERAQHLHLTRASREPWEIADHDAELAARWRALEDLPAGTLGRTVADFYRSRGFVYPGLPGSAPPLLAQHDWVHVLADYGTTVESEMEVFAFIARANDDLHAFSLLAMVVSLFETGELPSAAGLFEASPGHLSTSGMPVRVADAMRRGALIPGSVDFLDVDWFELAPLTVDEARAHFSVPPKSADAIAAGSVGPWDPGGISEFQVAAAKALAESSH